MIMKKVFAEIGFGNDSFFSTEFEEGDKEYRVPKQIMPSKLRRFWIFKKVFILSTNHGFEVKNKEKNKLKILFGISGERKTDDIPVRHRATAIIRKDDKFLLFHRIKPGHDYFMFPGGGVEEGETVEEALKREVKEELKVSVGDFRQLFVVDNIYAPAWATIHPGQKQIYHFFLIENYTGIPELSGPEKSQANDQNEYIIAWLSLDEIKQLDNVVPKEVVEMFLETMRPH